MTIAERFAEELRAAEVEYASVDGPSARDALERLDVSHKSLSFSVTRPPSDSDSKSAALGVRLRAAKTALAEAQARHRVATENAEVLAELDGATAEAVEADADFGAEVETALAELRQLAAVVEVKAKAAASALDAIPWSVRQSLGLGRPTLAWAGLEGVSPAELAQRISAHLGFIAWQASLANSTTLPNVGAVEPKREVFRTLFKNKRNGRLESESP
jgi:hypothetical protein